MRMWVQAIQGRGKSVKSCFGNGGETS